MLNEIFVGGGGEPRSTAPAIRWRRGSAVRPPVASGGSSGCSSGLGPRRQQLGRRLGLRRQQHRRAAAGGGGGGIAGFQSTIGQLERRRASRRRRARRQAPASAACRHGRSRRRGRQRRSRCSTGVRITADAVQQHAAHLCEPGKLPAHRADARASSTGRSCRSRSTRPSPRSRSTRTCNYGVQFFLQTTSSGWSTPPRQAAPRRRRERDRRRDRRGLVHQPDVAGLQFPARPAKPAERHPQRAAPSPT